MAGDTIEPETLLEARLVAQSPWGLTAQLQAGVNNPGRRAVTRLLVQYDRQWELNPFELQLFLQGGATGRATPYVRMFDLGGTFGAPFCFRQSLLTARPNEFTANVFAFLSLRFGFGRPLFEGWSRLFQIGTSPRPFIGMNAAWVVIFTRPIKKIVKFVLNAVFGFVLLFLVNYFGRAIGVSLEMTLVNCLVAGFIGIPGVLILLALKYLL